MHRAPRPFTLAKSVWEHAALLASVFAYALLASCCQPAAPQPAGLYQISIERGWRPTASCERVRYDLFIPHPDAALPPPPWPAVVLSHGFARDRTRQRNNAMYLAERGVVVMTPDMTSLLGGEPAQLRNIAYLVGDVAWLAERSATPGDALYGLLDPTRIGLAGHSAGGAVSFEAAIDTQSTPTPVSAVCLLDNQPSWHVGYRGNAQQAWLGLSFFDDGRAPSPEWFDNDSNFATPAASNWQLYEDEIMVVRIDANNILNHVNPTGLITTVNSTQYGLITSAGAMRSLSATVRLRF